MLSNSKSLLDIKIPLICIVLNISKDLNIHFSSVIPFKDENSLYFIKLLFIYSTGANLYNIQLLCFSSLISIGISTLNAFVLVTLSFLRGYLNKNRILFELLIIKANWKENFFLLNALKKM